MEKLKIFLFFLIVTLAFPQTLYASTMEVQNYNKAIGKKLTKAINDRKVVVPEYIRLHILDLSKSGYCIIDKKKARLSKPLILLLSALTNSKEISKSKPLSILSLFRTNSKNHGGLQTNGEILCGAADIDSFAGFRINIINPTSSLKAIVKIINTMPAGTYNMGLPRPGGGKLIDQPRDFFLPVKDLKQNGRSPTGSISGDLKLIKSKKARADITKAVIKNKKAKILYLMPDATDHLHVMAMEKYR